MAAFSRYGMNAHPEYRAVWDRFRRNLGWQTAGALFCSAALVLGLIAHSRGVASFGTGALLGVSAVVVLLWYMVWSGVRTKSTSNLERQIQSSIKRPERAYHGGPQVIELYPTHLRAENRQHDVDQRWTGIIRIDETAEHVFITRVDTATFIVPKRAFKSAEEAADFVAIARRYHLDAVGPTVRAYFAGREVGCSKCGYSLRDNAGLACPECGLAIDLAPICGAWDDGEGAGLGEGL